MFLLPFFPLLYYCPLMGTRLEQYKLQLHNLVMGCLHAWPYTLGVQRLQKIHLWSHTCCPRWKIRSWLSYWGGKFVLPSLMLVFFLKRMTSKLFLLIFLKNTKTSCPGCIYTKSYHPKCPALDSIAEIVAGLGPSSCCDSFCCHHQHCWELASCFRKGCCLGRRWAVQVLGWFGKGLHGGSNGD